MRNMEHARSVGSDTESEITYAQFRALANSIPNLAWMADPEGWIFWYNQRWYDYTGTTPEEMVGWGWQSVHHPDVLPEMLRRWTTALATGEPFEMTFPLRRGSDGSFRMFVTRAEPLREDGRIVGWFGTNTDITEQERTRERLQLVINELNHRVKNTLATVQSIASNSFRKNDPGAYRSFEQRLLALAGVHDLLARESWSRTSVDQIVRRAVSVCAPERVEIVECAVLVEARVASALSMTLHELATNAIKYGALSNETGRVRIVCREEHHGHNAQLVIEWREHDGPPVPASAPGGFGLKLIKRAASAENGASVDHVFSPEGVSCTIRLPLAAQDRGK